jgi:NitT/TauT family transport system permease protein
MKRMRLIQSGKAESGERRAESEAWELEQGERWVASAEPGFRSDPRFGEDRRDRRTGRFVSTLLVLAALLLWESGTRLAGTPVYILPGPSTIIRALSGDLLSLVLAGGTTLFEALAGLILGTGIGLAMAISLNFWSKLEQGILSLAILVKSTPIIAVAPILTIWLGFGPAPKVVVTGLLTFFPVLVNTLSGFRAADRAVLDLMDSLDASPWEVFIHVRWPSARPYLFTALKVVAPLSMIGAVVAEWMGASTGLGRQMWLAYSNLNMPSLFAAVFVLTLLSIALYQSVVWLEKRLLFWME